MEHHSTMITIATRRGRGRHRLRRRPRTSMVVGVCTTLVVGIYSAVFVAAPAAAPGPSAPAAIRTWPVRGELAGDVDLLDRAEQAWRASGLQARSEAVRPLYAQASPAWAVNLIVVVLLATDANNQDTLAFVTTDLREGSPDPSRLSVRAVAKIRPGQHGVGFIAAHTGPADTSVRGGGSIAFVLAAPGSHGLRLHNSVTDDHLSDGFPASSESFWRVTPTGWGPWNTTAAITPAQGGTTVSIPLAASVHDPTTNQVQLSTSNGQLRVASAHPGSVGDLLAIPETGVVGVVTSADGAIDTDPTLLNHHGRVHSHISRIPGTLATGADSTISFQPTGSGDLAEQNRIVLDHPRHPGLLLTIGRIHQKNGRWVVQLASAPTTATRAVLVSL